MKIQKLKFKQVIILIHIFVFGLIGYIYILDNPKSFPSLFKAKYSNPLMITKSLVHNIRNNDLEGVKKILEIPTFTNINIENTKGFTPLFIAIQLHSDKEILKLLIQHSDKTFKNKYDETALHFSILFANYNAFKLLLNNDYIVSKYHNNKITDLIAFSLNKDNNKFHLKSKFDIFWNVYVDRTTNKIKAKMNTI